MNSKNNRNGGRYYYNYDTSRRNAGKGNKKKKGKFPLATLFIVLLMITAVFVVIWTVTLRSGKTGKTQTVNVNDPQIHETDKTGTTGTTEPAVDPNSYTEVTLLVGGDIMYHSPQIPAAYDAATDTYDFGRSYRFIKDIVSDADYAVINFESTTAGNEYFDYQGYPTFNTPDNGLSCLKDAGFDMMLFANNHCYDTMSIGLKRTQEKFDEFGLDYIGARKTESDKSYKNVKIGELTVGMINTTDDLAYGNLSPRTVNGIAINDDDLPLMDVFNHSLMDEFYAQTESRIAELKSEGADLIVYYIHWGNEYFLEHNEMQGQIAQKLCDLGVDVIIGGHPHVIEDAEVLTSNTDPTRRTLCFYSLGNMISNQNRLTMGDTMNSLYTENGMFVRLTLRKYATGEALVTKVETIPTWVHRHNDPTTWEMRYDIVPIEAALASPDAYALTESSFGIEHATEALKMTNDLLGGICEAFAQTVN